MQFPNVDLRRYDHHIHNSLRPTSILAIMRETKTTVLIGVPRLFQLLYDTIKRYVVQSPEAMEAPLDPETVEEIQAALGGHIRVLVSGGAGIAGRSV